MHFELSVNALALLQVQFFDVFSLQLLIFSILFNQLKYFHTQINK